jgi:hypothetical protein
VGAVATNLVSRYQDLKSAAASTKLTMLQLGGPDAVATFEGLKDEIGAIADEYGITQSKAEEAYGVMAKAALDNKPDMDAFAAAVGLAKTNGADLNQIAKDFGEALKGNVGPLEGHLGLIGDLDQAYRNIEVTAKESKSWFDILAANTQNFVDDIVQGNWIETIKALTEAMNAVMNAGQLKTGETSILGQAQDAVTDTLKKVDDGGWDATKLIDWGKDQIVGGLDSILGNFGGGGTDNIGSRTSQKFLLGNALEIGSSPVEAAGIDASWARKVARQQYTKKTQFASSMRTMSHFMGEGEGITSANPVYVNLKATLNPAEVHRALDVEALASARAGISQAQSPYNPSWGISGFSPAEYGR